MNEQDATDTSGMTLALRKPQILFQLESYYDYVGLWLLNILGGKIEENANTSSTSVLCLKQPMDFQICEAGHEIWGDIFIEVDHPLSAIIIINSYGCEYARSYDGNLFDTLGYSTQVQLQ